MHAQTTDKGTEIITILKASNAKLLAGKCLSDSNFMLLFTILKETKLLKSQSHSLGHVCPFLRGANETWGRKDQSKQNFSQGFSELSLSLYMYCKTHMLGKKHRGIQI